MEMSFPSVDHDEVRHKVFPPGLDPPKHSRQSFRDHGVIVDPGDALDLVAPVTELVRKFAVETHLRCHGLIPLNIRNIKANDPLRDFLKLESLFQLERCGKRDPLPRVFGKEPFLPKFGKRVDLLLEKLRVLEPELPAGLFHPIIEILGKTLLTAPEKSLYLLDQSIILRFNGGFDARSHALSEVVIKTGRLGKCPAFPDRKKTLDQVHRLTQELRVGVRTIVIGFLIYFLPRDTKPRKFFMRDFDKRKTLIILEILIVTRLVFMDQMRFEKQRIDLRRSSDIIDRPHLAHEDRDLGDRRGNSKIRTDSLAKRIGFADIEDLPPDIAHQINAGSWREFLNNTT